MEKVFHFSTALFRQQPFNPPNTMPEWLMTQLRNAFATQNVMGIKRLNQEFWKSNKPTKGIINNETI